eukprot:TRINITY_DN1943_c2_g1_i1.p1 TRINITY_DN1943_c2_g1~~TRINITY_DN1943_c2_g1_i1.p1  ORF type:complete len:274 (-),score=96.78 TRINITY_DN1943_c2_g1_i1:9-830(-)
MDLTDEIKDSQFKKHGDSLFFDSRSIEQSTFFNFFFPANSTVANKLRNLNVMELIVSLPPTFWVYLGIILTCIAVFYLITVIETDPKTNRYDVKKKLKVKQKEEEKEKEKEQEKEKEKEIENSGVLGRKLKREEFQQSSVEIEEVLVAKKKNKEKRKEGLDKVNIRKAEITQQSSNQKNLSEVQKDVIQSLEQLKKTCEKKDRVEVKNVIDILQELKRQINKGEKQEGIKTFTENKGIKIVLNSVAVTPNNSSVVSLSNQILSDVLLLNQNES